jgi:hypothetical protein
MADRSWYFASNGQPQGPYPEARLREFIAAGTVTADTLVWTEGMAEWQKARDIPGLLSGPSGPPVLPHSGLPPAPGRPGAIQMLSADFGIWALLGRTLLYSIGAMLVIPAPWTATGFYRWLVEHLRVPQRPGLGFTGQPGDIWYVFVIQGLCAYAGFGEHTYPVIIVIPLQGYLSWMTLRWVVANVSAEGRALELSFAGSPWTYLGWYLLLYISAITIIGWAWVIAAWMRWMCLHLVGTRREIVFTGSGWQILWRTLVFVVVATLIIPIPWALGWYTRWYVSQFALVERTAFAAA